MEEYEKFYIEYGKFIIHFETINFQICYYIRKVCTNGDMFSDEDKRIDILLEGLTAGPLLSKFKSIFLTTKISQNLDVKKHIDIFIKNFTKVYEIRNFLAHGTFFAGDPLGNINNFQIRKPKLSTKGFQQNVNIISIDSIRKLNLDILKLENFISHFNRISSNEISSELEKKVFTEMKNSIDELNISLEILNKSVEY